MKIKSYNTSWFLKAFVIGSFYYALHKLLLFAGAGKAHFCFSGINGILPLLYSFLGGPGSSALIFLGALCRIFKCSFSFPFSSITMGIPNQGSLLVWATRENKRASFAINVLVPLAAILFFITRPGIGIGALYASFWLIPLFAFFCKDSLFKTALQSTFIAHAIGSCLWISMVSMTPMQWISLIPYVIIERALFTGMQLSIAYVLVNNKKSLHFLDIFRVFKLWYVNDR